MNFAGMEGTETERFADRKMGNALWYAGRTGQRLPKSSHNHFRFGRAGIRNRFSNSSLPPRAIACSAACLSTRVQTVPHSIQRNPPGSTFVEGPSVRQKLFS